MSGSIPARASERKINSHRITKRRISMADSNTINTAVLNVANNVATVAAIAKPVVQTGETYALNAIDSAATTIAGQTNLTVSVVIYILTAITTVAAVLVVASGADFVLKMVVALAAGVLWLDSFRRLGL